MTNLIKICEKAKTHKLKGRDEKIYHSEFWQLYGFLSPTGHVNYINKNHKEIAKRLDKYHNLPDDDE